MNWSNYVFVGAVFLATSACRDTEPYEYQALDVTSSGLMFFVRAASEPGEPVADRVELKTGRVVLTNRESRTHLALRPLDDWKRPNVTMNIPDGPGDFSLAELGAQACDDSARSASWDDDEPGAVVDASDARDDTDAGTDDTDAGTFAGHPVDAGRRPNFCSHLVGTLHVDVIDLTCPERGGGCEYLRARLDVAPTPGDGTGAASRC